MNRNTFLAASNRAIPKTLSMARLNANRYYHHIADAHENADQSICVVEYAFDLTVPRREVKFQHFSLIWN